MRAESKLRSLLKSFSWRIIAITDTVIVVLTVTCFFDHCSLKDAFAIGLFEFGFKFLFYYLHERIWQRIHITHRTDKTRTLIKTVSWRIVATLMTFIIAGAILEGDNNLAIIIALIEIITKTIFYYLHERLWLILPLGRIRNIFKKKTDGRKH